MKFSTGKFNNHFELAGRVSKIQSDGYIDRASSDLKSYSLQGSYSDENSLIKALLFGGHELPTSRGLELMQLHWQPIERLILRDFILMMRKHTVL